MTTSTLTTDPAVPASSTALRRSPTVSGLLVRHRVGVAVALLFLGIVGSATAGLALGAATERAQRLLPWSTSSLANSAGSWVVVTFLVALTARNVYEAAVRGAVTLVGLVGGFYLAAELSGIASDPRVVLFWMIAGVAFGPLVGAAAGAVRRGRPLGAALGAGTLGGLLVGEAFYGLHYDTATTSATYWGVQLALGVTFAVGLAWWRSRRFVAILPSGLACAAMAALTLGAYLRV
jgi:hypothetical protein